MIGFEYIDTYIAFISSNEGTIIRSHAEGFAGLVGDNTLNGQMIYCSSKNNVFVVYNNGTIYGGYYEMTEEKTAFSALFDGRTFILPNAMECVGVNKLDVNHVYAYTSDIDLDNFPSISTKNNEYLYTEAWAFGLETESDEEVYSWGYINNNFADLPILVKPENRLDYKQNLRFQEGYVESKEYAYGKNNGRGEYVLETIPAGSDTTSYTPFDDGTSNLFVGANGHVYELLTTLNGSFTVESAEYIITSRLSADCKEHLSGKDFEWKYRAIGGEEYAPYEGTTFDPATNPATEYYLSYKDEYVYLEALVTLGDKLNIEYTYVELGVGLKTIISTLGLRNDLSNLFNELGYTEGVSAILGYYEPTLRIYLDEEEITLEDLLKVERGNSYKVTVTFPSTNTVSGTTLSANFTITEGTIDTSKYQIESTIGGASELDAIVYDGESIDLDGVFSLKNFGLAQITAWEIVELERIDGNIYVGIDSVKDAGVYTLSITISVDGFQDVTRNILFYVARKEINVFVKVGGVEDEVTLNYYDALPTVSYHAEDGTNLDELKELSYLSTYSQGSKVTTGAEFYTLSFLAPTNEYLNMNYIINAVDSLVKIKVNPVKITTIGAVFPSLEEIYNGEEYALTFNESYILKNTLDPNPLDYTMYFEYEDESQATQFAFTDAGIYTIKAKVVSNTPNYLDSDMVEATLTIKKNKTTVKAFDTYVNYGEDAEYSILVTHTEYPSKINLRKVLMEGTHYTVNSSYVKGETKAGENVEFSISPLAYDDSLAGVLINYDITWDDTTAILTIGKKNYELDMVDSYEYTGKGVELDFNGEEFTFSEGYPIYKKLSSGVETDFVGVPANVCDGTFLYVVYFKVEETDEYYGTDVVRKEFSITKRMIDVSGLYVFHGEQKTPLSDNLTFIYDKSEYRIDIDRNEFNGGGDIVFTYTYKLFDDSEEYTIHTPIMLTDVVRIKEISLSITGDNYENWTSDLDISSFTIAPREVALDNDKLSPLQYKGYEYDIDFMTERVNALPFASGYAPIEGDQVAFSVALKENGRIIRDPGAYTLVVTSLNPNYVYATSDTYTLTQGVNSGRAYVNLENYDFGEFEYSTVRINAPYIIAKDFEFIIDDTETLKADVKFFINYNSAMQTDLNGALAPGTYSITSAESITGDVNGEITEFIAFEVKNGVDKVKIKPLAITFNYLNMTSGAVGGIKPSYVYGDPDLSSLPNYVARAMTRALSGIDYTEVPDIRITCDKDTIKHAGTYTFTATANKQTINDEGVLVDCFTLAEEVRSYTMKVEKREITVELTPVQIYVGENAPITYKVNYPLSTSEPIGNEKLSLTYSFSVQGFDNTQEGDYAVTIDEVKLNEGGVYYYDYVPIKLNPSAKELSVRFMEFDSSLTAQGLSTVYTGYPVYPTVSGVPDDAVVSYSITPINVGNHSVTVTVSKHKYRTKTFECAVNITPATPTIVFDGANSFPFDVRHELSHSDVNAYAHLNGVRVEGTFYFMQTDGLVETEYLRYGKYTYRVGFNPTSSNFTSVAGLSYEMTTYLEEDDYAITINDGPVVESITSTENVTLKLVTSERVGSSMIMLVDGNNSYNQYVFEESASNVLIDLRIRNVSVYSVIINVVIQEETPDVPSGEDPLPPEEDDNLSSGENEGGTNMGGNNSGSGNMTPEEEQTKDEGSNLGLIIGLSVGGGVLVIAGVVVAVVLILKKKRD
ncbi:MAG: hypothetical protein IKB56_06070 [Clostridia bacterium]|nr:hypothetical protein [Clostridia bacterium]